MEWYVWLLILLIAAAIVHVVADFITVGEVEEEIQKEERKEE